MTIDGFKFSTIVDKINNKSNLIFLYLTENQRIFGVYIQANLYNIVTGKEYKDENAFVFSLNNNKIYKILIPQHAIRFNSYNCTIIGNSGNNNGFFFDYNTNIIEDNGLLNWIVTYEIDNRESPWIEKEQWTVVDYYTGNYNVGYISYSF